MTSSTNFHHVIQIISQIRSCDQSLVTVAFLWKKLTQPQFYKGLTRKTSFFDRLSWFKFNNLGLALGTNLKFYTSVAKGLKLKVRKFWRLVPTFVEVTGEKLVKWSKSIEVVFLTNYNRSISILYNKHSSQLLWYIAAGSYSQIVTWFLVITAYFTTILKQ